MKCNFYVQNNPCIKGLKYPYYHPGLEEAQRDYRDVKNMESLEVVHAKMAKEKAEVEAKWESWKKEKEDGGCKELNIAFFECKRGQVHVRCTSVCTHSAI